MPQAFAKAQTLIEPEYSVYIYHRPENQHEGQNDWEMRTSTLDLNVALDEAESLYESQSFRKVEVKQRIVDPKTEQVRDYTLKVFANDKDAMRLHLWFAAFCVLFVSMGMVALLAKIF